MTEQVSGDFNEYDRFVDAQENGHLLQSSLWGGVKREWTFRAFVLRGDRGEIRASAGLLMRKIPCVGSLAYLPRGPVFPRGGEEDAGVLLSGIMDFCRESGCFSLICDPYLRKGESRFPQVLEELGFRPREGGRSGFGGIQPRFLFTRGLSDTTEEALIASFSQKTRYNLRLAGRKGVRVRRCGEEDLGEFQRLMEITGARDGFTVRTEAYFRNFLVVLGNRARLYLAYCGDEAIAGAIATRFAGRVTYNYGASDNLLRNVMPNYPLQLEMMRWALENHCTQYDFGGVPGDPDKKNPLYGLRRFKEGFGGQFTELIGEYHYSFHPLAYCAFRTALAASGRTK